MINHSSRRVTGHTLRPAIREASVNITTTFCQAEISRFNPYAFTDDDFIGAHAVSSADSPLPSSVRQPVPSNGQSASTLGQDPPRIK
jgi:hypothetical protein